MSGLNFSRQNSSLIFTYPTGISAPTILYFAQKISETRAISPPHLYISLNFSPGLLPNFEPAIAAMHATRTAWSDLVIRSETSLITESDR